jgi:hypothetical protein
MKAQGLDHIVYDYYGEADPEVWGVRYTSTLAAERNSQPIEGWVAVHVTLLERLRENYAWLAGRQPVAVIGHTIFVYHLTAEDAADTRSRPVQAPEGGGER